MPSIAVPRVTVPSVVVPTVTPGGPQAMSASPWMNPARADAIVQADRLGLNYLPGEVLVKFKDGVDAAGETRALQVLASQPTADTIEWAGEVAVVRDRTQPNAYILADQLKGQPEVEYAEPNFIARIDPWEQASTPVSTAPSPPRGHLRCRRRAAAARVTGVPNDADYAGYPVELPADQHAGRVGHPARRQQRRSSSP